MTPKQWQIITTGWLCTFIFWFPCNLFWQMAPQLGYVAGLRSDYLIPKLFVSDLLMIGWLGIMLAQGVGKEVSGERHPAKLPQWWRVAMVVLSVALLARQFWTAIPLTSIWQLLQLVLTGLTVVTLKKWWTTSSREAWVRYAVGTALMIMTIFQSSVGLLQWVQQRPTFPSYRWFGESRLVSPVGLATTVWQGSVRILPYGTTPHPNVLGAVLALAILCTGYLLISDHRTPYWLRWCAWTSFVVGSITLLLTQSVSAWITLGVGGTTLWLSTRISARKHRLYLPLVFLAFVGVPLMIWGSAPAFPNATSLSRRASLQRVAVQEFQQQPIWGSGLQMFTARTELRNLPLEAVRFLQPVHHIGLLWISEAGLLSFAWLSLGAWGWWRLLSTKERVKILAVTATLTPVAVLDHFLLTQRVGQLLIILMIFLTPRVSTKQKTHTR